MLALISWLSADSVLAPVAHCITDLFIEAILQFIKLLVTYLLTYILILEMQGKVPEHSDVGANFQNNMKL